MKSVKLMDLTTTKGLELEIIKDLTAAVNPYRLFAKWTEYRPDTFPAHHRKLIERFADLTSAVLHAAEIVRKLEYNR